MGTPSAGEEDAELLRALAGGEEGALRLLYERHAPWLWVRLLRRCHDEDLVADVVQETFLAVWRGADRFRGDGPVAAWIWGIGVRRLVSRLRAAKAPAPVTEETVAAACDGAVSAEDSVLLGVEHGDLGAALRRLSPELRVVVQATLLDGLTTRESARLLGLPQGTVKGRVRRAKELLRLDLVTAETRGRSL
jgi:RNA polymerase sigma factor (sigma-70 family)